MRSQLPPFDDFRAFFETAAEGFCILQPTYRAGQIKDLFFVATNAAFQRHTSLGDVTGLSLSKVLPVFAKNWIDLFAQVSGTGEPARQEQYVEAVDRWYHVSMTCIGGTDTPLVSVILADISNRQREELALSEKEEKGHAWEGLASVKNLDQVRSMQERQQVMVAELQHRTRNLIGVVRSLAQQTMLASADMDDFWTTFSQRLAALSRVQGLLSKAEQQRITIRALLWSELDAMGASELGGRVSLDGPEVTLRNSSVQTLALALHELATNARKYGALAQEQGTLAVTWSVEQDAQDRRWLDLSWRESGVRLATPDPAATTGGYGRELIEQALPYALGARTTYSIAGDGVRCTIFLPLDRGEREDD